MITKTDIESREDSTERLLNTQRLLNEVQPNWELLNAIRDHDEMGLGSYGS